MYINKNTKYFGHMTKMTPTPIYGKDFLKNQKAGDLETWY